MSDHDVEIRDERGKEYGVCKNCGKVGPPPFLAGDEWDDPCDPTTEGDEEEFIAHEPGCSFPVNGTCNMGCGSDDQTPGEDGVVNGIRLSDWIDQAERWADALREGESPPHDGEYAELLDDLADVLRRLRDPDEEVEDG